jgi:multiple RNA-binding domain-containing protein 1
VCLDAFISNAAVERSRTVVLVKNLPFSAEPAELRALFGRFGALQRVVLPPVTKSIALVEFLEANEAKAAFRALAYSKFHAAPLFLEWAPVNSLGGVAGQPLPVKRVVENPLLQRDSASPPSPEDRQNDSRNTLYVKNLSFKTGEAALRAVFQAIDAPIRSVRIPTKPSPANAAVALSLGFGFVEFALADDVNRALDRLQGVQLDGHALVLKRASGGVAGVAAQPSKKRKAPDSSAAPGENSCKLIIRNVPFEAAEAELRALLKSFTGALKRLRLPRKFDGSHRGFAFAQFTTHAEAKHVMDTLAATHFYGRHLVIEWAHEAPDTLLE